MNDDIFSFIDAPIIAPAPPPAQTGNEWRLFEGWLAIKGITHKEIYTPCGRMERAVIPGVGSKCGTSAPKSVKIDPKEVPIGFGKYRDLSAAEIKKNDPRYFEWLYTNVDKFTKLCNNLGLKP